MRAGLIPAHAGKTKIADKCVHHDRAHPRSRGENLPSHPAPLAGGGSSPLTRGKHKFKNTLSFAGGLIPAHAGKTLPRQLRRER